MSETTLTNHTPFSTQAYQTKLPVAMGYTIAVVGGILAGGTEEPSWAEHLLSVALQFTIGLWCLGDAQASGRPIPFFSQAWVVFFGAFVVPVYLIYTRGWRGVALLLLNLAAWTGVYIAVGMTTYMVVPSAAQSW